MGDSVLDDQYESCVPVNSFLTNGPILLPEDSVSIHDADEEVSDYRRVIRSKTLNER
jgi:hypothetical protein